MPDLDLSARTNAEDVDRADVARVLAGELEAFESIVRRWQGPLLNMAWRYCHDRGRAEEMAQEAFVHAWRGLAQWRGESSFSTWLFSVAANVYRNELKKTPTTILAIEDVSEPGEPAGQENSVLRRRREEMVRRAVLALPARYRDPLVLFYFQEMNVGMAARTLHMPEGTLKARLARGRKLLRRKFPQLRDEQTDASVENLRGREA